MTDKKKKKNRLVNALLILLFLVGLCLIFNQQLRYLIMSINSGRWDGTHFTAEDFDRNNNKKGDFDFKGVESVSTEAVLKAQFTNPDLPVVGQIAIPKLNVHLPIFKGVNNVSLLYGAGTMKEDQKMGQGNYCLASHRVDDPKLLFSPIQKAEKGQMIFITNLKKIYQYKITLVKRVTPTHVEVLDDVKGRKMITLVTCNDPGALKRVIVQGDLVDEKPVKKSTQEMHDAFEGHINQGDW